MGTKVVFAGAERILPGAYSTIVSGENNEPLNLPYGKVLIIDTGTGATWGGGAGINGSLANGQDSVYHFTDLESYLDFLKGGIFSVAAQKMFYPFRNFNGISDIYHVKAATTVAASMTLTVIAGGVFKVDLKDEGVIGNGTLTSTHLDKGYGYKLEAGVNDTSKYIFKIYRGSWVGDHTDGIAYNEIEKSTTKEILVIQSPEVSTVAELITWANTSTAFGAKFKLNATSSGTDGTIAAGDITANFIAASGGTEVYSTDDLSDVFEAISELDYQFILCDDYGSTDFDSAYNQAIKLHIEDPETLFDKTMIVGGGEDEDEFTATDGSVDIAEYYDSDQVIVVHGGVKTTSQLVSTGFREWPSLIHAATVLGRVCGLPPQVPVTNKKIGIDGLKHNPTKKQQKIGLQAGVLMTIPNQYDLGTFKVLQGVNSMQDNEVLFNAQGNSFSVQFMRIVAQINRELVINSELDLLSDESGVNVNTLSPKILQTWTENYLNSRVATPEFDNYILDFRNVTVSRVDDYYKVNYGIVVNNEISKIFFTGFLFKQ